MAHLNKVMLIGRLTRDPDPGRTIPTSGVKAVRFSLAVGRSRKNPESGQWESDPNVLFIECDVFNSATGNRRLADLVEQYLRKGSQVFVEGRLRLDQWDDKNTGQKREKIKIVVDNLEFLDTRQQEGGPSTMGAPRAATVQAAGKHHGEDEYGSDSSAPVEISGASDDIPF